jgi:hypothetical protein
VTTRILYWNIQDFGFNKMADSIDKRANRVGSKRRRVDVTARRDLIRRHLNGLAADIIVIVEVSTGPAGAAGLIGRSGGWEGLGEVLTYLRTVDPASNWNLVPPIIIGEDSKCEGVGIFYKSNIAAGGGLGPGFRFFTGPNRFNGGMAGTSFDPLILPAPAAGNYPPGINFFSNGRVLPAVALYNAGQQENQCAARTAFRSVATPGFDVNFGNFRQPYMATFTETDNGAPPVLRRHVTIFAVHSPPHFAEARRFLSDMADVNDVAAANAVNETKAIVGDFNVNLLRAAGTKTTAYNHLIGGGGGGLAGGNYTLMLHPTDATFDAGVTPGYFATHMKQLGSGVFWSVDGTPSKYPGYGYVGSSNSDRLYSIDNVLVRPPAGGAQVSIINSVVGSPLTAYPWAGAGPPPPLPPVGAVHFDTSFALGPPKWLPTQVAPAFEAGMAATFRSTANFGHIRSASDHFALVADI